MSDLHLEEDMNYLSEMNDDDKVVFLKVLARLAQTDGSADDGERRFIGELAQVFQLPADRTSEVKRLETDDAIVEESKKIKNRRTAMELIKEMCMLANSDGDLSDRETLLIGRVGRAMGLELDKIEQISQWVIDRIIWLEEGKIIFEKV